MARKKKSNGRGVVPLGMPMHNALGIENWPQHVQDEHRRVPENDRDRKFIPFEDFMVAGLDGRSLMNAWDLAGMQNIFNLRGTAIRDACNIEFELGDKAADEFLEAASMAEEEVMEAAEARRSAIEGEEDLASDVEAERESYRAMYPWLFKEIKSDDKLKILRRELTHLTGDEPVSFHGAPHRCSPNVKKKKVFRKKSNSKRYRHWEKYDSIRMAYIESQVADAERMAIIGELAMSAHFDERVDIIYRTTV